MRSSEIQIRFLQGALCLFAFLFAGVGWVRFDREMTKRLTLEGELWNTTHFAGQEYAIANYYRGVHLPLTLELPKVAATNEAILWTIPLRYSNDFVDSYNKEMKRLLASTNAQKQMPGK